MPKGAKKRAAAKKKALQEENSVNVPDNQEKNSSEHETPINIEPGNTASLTIVGSDSCQEEHVTTGSENDLVQQSAGLMKFDDCKKHVDPEITCKASVHDSTYMYGVVNDIFVVKLKSSEQVQRIKTSVIEELKAAENLVAFLHKVLDDLNSLQT